MVHVCPQDYYCSANAARHRWHTRAVDPAVRPTARDLPLSPAAPRVAPPSTAPRQNRKTRLDTGGSSEDVSTAASRTEDSSGFLRIPKDS